MIINYQVHVNVSYHELQALYKGAVQRIIVLDRSGKTVSLPASHFMPFITHRGIYGWFNLQTSESGKFISLQPCED
ncbi:DUF2835 domain-containing protein [Neiella marina]|uniref:DUF2835 domain-containing protein n=1 Tax=Neiella holothuriorum TaxID=2870530 RepID=A0ABS7EDH3_9GAMM|nr:DUF2835 domain-containing protein [Neiella holothuriorum]